MYSVLFVCTANQCRSPMAEAWFNRIAAEAGLEVSAGSAGILANTGIPATPDAIDVLEEHGVNLEDFRSRELTLPLLRQADRIVVMTKDHADQVRRLEPTVSDKTFMLSEFLGVESDIEDPIGLDYEFYHECFNGMRPALQALLEDIDKVLHKRKTSFTRTIGDFLDNKFSIVIGSDHGGYDLKNALVEHLRDKGIDVEDLGPHNFESGDDFPDFAGPVSKRVAESPNCAGILICKSGIGMSINANRFRNVRAALVKTPREASISRMHNCSNLLVAGGNDLTNQRLIELAETWLATPYSKEERHTRRLLKLEVNSDNNLIAIREVDPEIARYIEDEADRQNTGLELIASENFVSPAIRAAAGTILTNKYAEGYPGERWYSGCEQVDKIENLAIHRACKLFGAQAANVQPHSGTQANMTAYQALLQTGDTVLAMAQEHGGHLSHGTKVNFSGRLYKFIHYGISKDTEVLDYDAIQQLAKEHSPSLIVVGASTYSRVIDFQRMRQIADDCGAHLMCDMSHIAGIVAANLHPNPVPYCDVVTSTTHKTLRGPRGGMILCKREHIRKINAQNFPGVQGGPLMHLIAAKAICFKEAASPQFAEYIRNVLQNASDLADALMENGYRIVSGGTDNHQMTLDLSEKQISTKDLERALEVAGITVNSLPTPYDPQLPNHTSGIRIGTAAITTRGMGKTEMLRIAHLIDQVVVHMSDTERLQAVREDVLDLVGEFPAL